MARDSGQPVISEFSLYAFALKLFRDRGYAGSPLPPRNNTLTERRARKLLFQATSNEGFTSLEPATNRLPRDPDFSSVLFMLAPAETIEVMMTADPFCYLSHASALAFHGLAPEQLEVHFTLPDRKTWQILAKAKMEAVIGFPPDEAEPDELPFRLTRQIPLPLVRGRSVLRHELRFTVAATVRNGIRATPIGETFRDTLAAPHWCGGIRAVIDIWREHATKYVDEIITSVNTSAEKILRVRAGYLLDEVLGINDPRISAWAADAQRGSSRKLDSATAYESRFSEKWMLSINVPDTTLPATTA